VIQATPQLFRRFWTSLMSQPDDSLMDEEPGPRRTRKYQALKVLLRGGNRVMRWQLRHGLAPRAFALLETTGRASGLPRYTCVGNGLDGDTFWVIAAHGRQADWVRNIIKDPQVRVLAGRGWRHGTASLMPEYDTVQRSRALPYQWDAAVGRAIATTPLTVRIDLR
jgi:deazaflavin-dependent oxidoreductase (nitroreductase family)